MTSIWAFPLIQWQAYDGKKKKVLYVKGFELVQLTIEIHTAQGH